MTEAVHIVGGGMAGSEAAWQLASAGVPVILYEMRGVQGTDAHDTDNFAELVCSNSFRSDDHTANAVGVLHEEMRRLGSLIMACADQARVPAGSALAVDRNIFSQKVTKTLSEHALVTVRREIVQNLPGPDDGKWIIATGPLTHSSLADDLVALTGQDQLAFFDALAPIVHRDSIDFDIAWFQSRWDKGDGKDYINCPLDHDQYEAFIDALLSGDKTNFKEWEQNTPYFEGCMPIEVMAERGRETLRFGPMKPVGLTNPATGKRAHAVIQLRQDNALGSLWNIVGFQTKLKHGEQVRVFRTIPGLEKAEFARLGGLHRNTFIKSPALLDETLRLKARPNIRFAGQITGCEGYIESAAVGLMAARYTAADVFGQVPDLPPVTTAHGALLSHITGGAEAETFQPMNVNFGLFPPLAHKHHKKERKAGYAARALADMDDWIASTGGAREAAA